MHGGADGSGAPKVERNGNCKNGPLYQEVVAKRPSGGYEGLFICSRI